MSRKENKVLHIDIEKGWGGGQRQVLLLLSKMNKENHILLCRKGSRLESESRKAGIFVLPYESVFSLIRYYHDIKKIKIVHSHSSKSLNIGIILKKVFGVQLFYTKRVYNIHLNRLSMWKLRQVEQFVAISQFVQRQLIKNKVPSNKIKIIYSAVQPVQLKKISKPNKKIIGSIGKLTHMKNQLILLKAVKKLLMIRQDFTVYIIGDGPEKNFLKQFAEENNISSYVKFLGYRKNALDYFLIFDVFIFPSKLEGLGTSVLDAMLYKVPVIASSAPALPEMIKHKETGLLFSPEDENYLAEEINEILDNKKLRAKIIENAYRAVQKKFSVKVMAEQYRKIYKEKIIV